jgi:galactokinase/mevalonate kinase-like predicted kinase
MTKVAEPWDYLVISASNPAQARSYEAQLQLRRRMGFLPEVAEALVIADPGGRRAGSGGSTLHCLVELINRELDKRGIEADGPDVAADILRDLRILIVHAGGDSRRLPAYGPCGKIFVPLPGEDESALGTTLFDRLVSILLNLPPGPGGAGQVVVAAGDALLLFDSESVDFSESGLSMLGCPAAPEEASRHGVYCLHPDGGLRLYLQKPSLEEQAAVGAVSRDGKTVLDIGVAGLDAATAAALLHVFGAQGTAGGRLTWSGPRAQAVRTHGLDLYREICCALGSEATVEHYVRAARAGGSAWNEPVLAALFAELRVVRANVRLMPRCQFLHFGTTGQLIVSGLALVQCDKGRAPESARLRLATSIGSGAEVTGGPAWIEGCRLQAPLQLGGNNVLVGVDSDKPLALPENACLDVLSGRGRDGRPAWFIRCYGLEDSFKAGVRHGATFCGMPLADWLEAACVSPADAWDAALAEDDRSLWNARVFPAEADAASYRRWLWMFQLDAATADQKREYLRADRYSAAEIALLSDHAAFHERRSRVRADEVSRSLRRLFLRESPFSAEDLAHALEHSPDRAALVARVLAEARWHATGDGLESFAFGRVVHSLGTAIAELGGRNRLPDLAGHLDEQTARWLSERGLTVDSETTVEKWSDRLKAAAFRELTATILQSSLSRVGRPRNALRPDETIWGRAPARLELGGGWTDTPPYTLEFGGDVTNAAVNLNGQPPIHCYCRVVEEPVIRLSSIDTGRHIEISELTELLDYRRPGDGFALAKAALAISGFSPEIASWPDGVELPQMLEEFGGGIELTTLVGIPKGSGLGTSSILGAVILAVIQRMMGRTASRRELFHDVLRLEQALTTGGGWQDQIGGGVGGTKITSTAPGLIADPRIHYVPDDLLDPRLNGGSTLLYYTGLTRLAKDILQEVVGGYFNRNRRIMTALAQEHRVARAIAGAMARKDAAEFGHYVNVAWRLQQELCQDVTNESIESLMARVRPHVHGMRISGAGSGGFLMMICKSPGDAASVRAMLDAEPLNERSRFFDFEINHAGLEVTTC